MTFIILFIAAANCDYNEFTCDNGDCQPLGYKCDGYDDCGDYSDEDNCDGMCIYTLIHNHQSITIKWYTELDTTLCNVYSIYCSSLNLQLSIIGR